MIYCIFLIHVLCQSYLESDEYPPEGMKLEPSKLSLKDRVNMFDKLIGTGTKAPSAAPTPYPTTSVHEMSFPIHHSSSAQISSATQMNYFNHKNSSAFNNNVMIGQFHQLDPGNAENVPLDQGLMKRRGSTSDLELSSTPKYSPVMGRDSKTKSVFVSDDGSEDGEFSSGGQEVSEIISRSYENSPM
jgi:hypothetical protein